MNISYLLMNSDADWAKEIDERFLRRSGKLVSTDARHFVSAARSHWRLELLSVGLKVLETLEALHKLSIKNSMSVFSQCMPLVYIFEVTKFLLGSKYLDCKHRDTQKLHDFLNLSTVYFENVFPLDWRKSLSENMLSLRRSELSRNLLEEVILVNISFKGKLTYGQIGRVVMICLGSGKPTDELFVKIAKRFEGNLWKEFIEDLSGKTKSEISQENASGNLLEVPREVSSVYLFHKVLKDTFNANWREYDYISPSCFMYLVERLLISASCFRGFLFTTKSSFVEWHICGQSNANRSANLASDVKFPVSHVFDFLAYITKQFLYDKQGTAEWIKNSKINFNYYYPLFLLRLVVTVCLLCVNCGKYFEILHELLGSSHITLWLPREFYDVLWRRRKPRSMNVNANVVAEAFMKIGNPLVIVRLREDCPKYICPGAVFVDMRVTQSRDDIIRVLFPMNNKAPQGQTVAVEVETTNSCGKELPSNNDSQGKNSKAPSSNLVSMTDRKTNSQNINEGSLQMNSGLFWEISDALKSLENIADGNVMKFVSSASKIKAEVGNCINLISAAMTKSFENKLCDGEDGILFAEANSTLDELKQLSSALDVSDKDLEKNILTIAKLLRSLHLKRPRLETFLNWLVTHNGTNVDVDASEASTSYEEEASHSKVKETSNSDKGKALQPTVPSGTQNSGNNRNAESNKGKGNNKSKKGKKGKGGRKNK